PVNKQLCQIPSTDTTKTVIPVKGRLIVWADNQSEQGPLHIGLKLDKDGESVTLSRKDGSGSLMLVDSVSFPAMVSNMSYARLPDGGSDWVIQAPTWNTANQPMSLVQPSGSPVLVYPTLVSTSFYVLNASGLTLTIFDLTGKMLCKISCTSDRQEISTGMLSQGLYLVKIGNQTIKIMKRAGL
ncbi:MAG: T9SS type A sorting domain-containing protein, partial [Bacteroidota bacterium]|nr:T9SS type A sorting domain-containing protein [Bacteroidota bacterium]